MVIWLHFFDRRHNLRSMHSGVSSARLCNHESDRNRSGSIPPVAASQDVRLLPFRAPAPSRRIAMVWRRSSAMSEFLTKLAAVFRDLPADLLTTGDVPTHAGARHPRVIDPV